MQIEHGTGRQFVPELIEDDKPCGPNGCLAHVKRPCEKCGRVGGRGGVWIKKYLTHSIIDKERVI